ncbi:protein of unknown function [Cupriavidus taiwanensis]|nr:protein of unknown function [Cupriavidus taiwanensis]
MDRLPSRRFLLLDWLLRRVGDSAGGMAATLTDRPMQKARLQEPGFPVLVAWDGIEPPTQGFSILCSTD